MLLPEIKEGKLIPPKESKLRRRKRLRKQRSARKARKAKLAKKNLKYKDYIRSSLWKKRRAKYYERFPKECVVCKSTRKIALHHMNYANLGREKDEDLVALCWEHHGQFHEKHGMKNLKEDSYAFIEELQQEIEMDRIKEWCQ